MRRHSHMTVSQADESYPCNSSSHSKGVEEWKREVEMEEKLIILKYSGCIEFYTLCL